MNPTYPYDSKRFLLPLLGMIAVATLADAQISEDYVAGDPSGWINRTGDNGQLDPLDPNRGVDGIIDVSTWQIGKQIVGTEGPTPHPITGGDGPSVLTFDIREPIPAGSQWDTFQKADRDFSFSRSQFESHVVWVEYSSFANYAGGSQELVKFGLTFRDDLGAGVQLQNLFSTRTGQGFNGSRANQVKPRRALLRSDGMGGFEIDPNTGAPFVRDGLDGNLPNEQFIFKPLIHDGVDGAFLFSDGIEPADLDPNDADGDQRVLNTLFEQTAVIRLNDYQNFNFEVEWRATNPDAAGDANWRSFQATGLGSGTDFENSDDTNTLILTEPIRDISTISLLGTRRDIPGEEGGILPSIIRAESNIDINQSSTNGEPNEATANQQVGLGKFIAQVYHAGDLNRDGQVTASDVTDGPLLANLGATTVEDTSIEIGDQLRDVSWVDGDTLNNGLITVGDAMAALTGVAGAGPAGVELDYDSATGRLRIVTGGQQLSGFALVAEGDGQFLLGSYNDPTSGAAIGTAENMELSWMNLTASGTAAGSNLSGNIDLGTILPTGLTDEQLEEFFAAAVFNVGDALSKSVSFFGSDGLPGDFNGDGSVDAADYTVWRDGLGTTFVQADYDTWVANFGATAPSSSAVVPEPAGAVVGLVLLALTAMRGKRG